MMTRPMPLISAANRAWSSRRGSLRQRPPLTVRKPSGFSRDILRSIYPEVVTHSAKVTEFLAQSMGVPQASASDREK